ncbi:MAG: hypothetical protein HY314_15605 [Acidobacteria bacterium]|nr:hypothetical protein [Acidobacteriota bacterium]
MAINFDDEFQERTSGRWSIGFLRVPPGGSTTDVATRRDDPEGVNPNCHSTVRVNVVAHPSHL